MQIDLLTHRLAVFAGLAWGALGIFAPAQCNNN